MSSLLHFEHNVQADPENRLLLATFEPRKALFVDLRNMQEPGGSFHDLRDLLAVFVNLVGVFVSRAGEKLHRWREGFVPVGQPFETFINRHRLPPTKKYPAFNA
jgi:hypothetical protein